MKLFNLFIVVISFGFLLACKSNPKQSSIISIESFESFHNRFYSDSIFQLSRIKFPLPGADSDVIYGDEEVADQENDLGVVKNNKLFWKRKGWKLLKAPIINDNEFVLSLVKEGPIMKEQIRSKETDMVITLEFSLIGNKWMLSYFSHEWY